MKNSLIPVLTFLFTKKDFAQETPNTTENF